MPATLRNHGEPVQAKSIVSAVDATDNELVSLRRLVREAIEESGWKHEAVAAHLGTDGPHLSNMLSGLKPLTLKRITELPDDINAIFARKYAESFGQIVVQPVYGEQAVKNLVSGLFGVLAPKPRMARAKL